MGTTRVFSWPLDVVARPSRLVDANVDRETADSIDAIARGVWISAFYFANLVVYSLPLTLSGFGLQERRAAPGVVVAATDPFVGSPQAVWEFASALFQNSAFLFVASILVFLTFHFGLWLSRSSRGVIRSMWAVSYSTGIYIAVMFTIAWFVATSPAVAVADDLLLWIQSEFFYFFIDLLGAPFELPGGRVPPADTTQLTGLGKAALTGLVLSAVYALYVLFVGAKRFHGATNFEASVAVGFVLVSPAIYVVGTIVGAMVL